MHFPSLLVLSLVVIGAGQPALAQEVGQHPALFSPRSLPGVNPNAFIVGHPASPRTRSGHANHEHPAVAHWAAQGQAQAIDSNRFLVQPPATVQWALGPLGQTPAVASSRAGALAAVVTIVR